MAPRRGWRKPGLPSPFSPAEMSYPGEEWRPVVGWERHYRVSDLGRVYSLHQSGRLATGMSVRGGYRVVKLRSEGRRANVPVHHMVLEAFVGPRPKGLQGCHGNGNSNDNRLENLRWDTALANHADRLRHGTSLRGRPPSARLTHEQIHAIRTDGKTDAHWARTLRVSSASIGAARTGKTWPEHPTPPDRRRREGGGRYSGAVATAERERGNYFHE
jgi:hypothetical protein